MATTAFGRGARAVDPASLLLGPRPPAAVPALLRLVVVRSSPSAQVPQEPLYDATHHVRDVV